MIEETGIVVDVQDDFAWVETRRHTVCESCSVNKGCGSAVLAKVLGRRRSVVRAIRRIDAAVGDEVVLGLEDSALLRGSFMVYGAPLLAMFVFAVIGDAISTELQWLAADLVAVIFGLSGLFAGLVWVRRYGNRINNDVRFQPVLLRRLAHGEATRVLF